MADRGGPVRSWADMSDDERARIRSTAKPPPKERVITPTPDFICSRRGQPERPPVELCAEEKVRETERAALYRLADGSEKWIPKSVIVRVEEFDDGTALVTVRGWFADKEGIHG